MATMAERAKAVADKHTYINADTEYDDVVDACIEIATEQHKIDVNKAITFLRQYGEGDFSCFEEFESVFRKAMEE